jgi:cytochrome P450
MNHAFSPKSVHGLIPVFVKHTAIVNDILAGEINQEVDVSVLFTRLTLDIIGESAFGYSFNSLKNQ